MQIKSKKEITFSDQLRGVWVFTAFSALLIFEIPFLLFFERFTEPKERSTLWRVVGQHNCYIFLRLWGIHLKISHQPQHSFPVIYTCNHPSLIDGFILFAFLGPNMIAVTAPFTSFHFPFNYWFRHMGFVDIQRDQDDANNHPMANTKEQAFRQLFQHLQAGRSLLVFPEGHVERTHQLHYVHTGVARLSLQSKTPVQIMTIAGLERVYVGSAALRRGDITIRFGKLCEPPAVSHYVPFRKVVPYYAKDIERYMVALLPLQYLPEYYASPPQGIAAFVDIDRTLYHGYSQKDFIRYLLKKKYVSRLLPLKALWWVTLEKLHVIPHRQLMQLSLGLLKGLSVKEIDHWCQDFFQEVAVHKMNHHVLPYMKDHLAQGHLVILVSEAIHPLAKQFKEYVHASTSIDTILRKHHGYYTGSVERLNYQFTKADMVERFAKDFGIDLQRSYAYSDSTSDLPLLYSVRHRIAVNPDTQLRLLAQQHHWQTLS